MGLDAEITVVIRFQICIFDILNTATSIYIILGFTL